MLKKCLFVTALSSAMVLSGCATIVSKKSYNVLIESDPSNVAFSVINRQGVKIAEGRTPYTLRLRAGAGYFKKATYTIKFKSPQFGEQEVVLTPSLDGWYWGNFVIGGLVGLLIVDPLTGAMYKLPAGVYADLKYLSTKNAIKVTTLDKIPQDLHAQLIRVN